MTIQEHIATDIQKLAEAKREGNQPAVGHLTGEIAELKEYVKAHPDEEYDPTPLELYCELNPGAPECRIYED